MVEPSYVPVLPTTRAAQAAFRHLDVRARRRIAPMWTVIHLATKSRLRLVTGPERDPQQQRYIADLAFLSGRGPGIRVLLDVLTDDDDRPHDRTTARAAGRCPS